MACKNAYVNIAEAIEAAKQTSMFEKTKKEAVLTNSLVFGVDSRFSAEDILQNNIKMFEWVSRNKLRPNFWIRNIAGENALTKEEIKFLHKKGCKIGLLYSSADAKETEKQGKTLAQKVAQAAAKLNIPGGVAIFLEIEETEKTTKEFLAGFIGELELSGYYPAFKVNTDAKYTFDREFSRGMQMNEQLFSKCIIWAVSPSLKEYDGMTTTHFIHPDEWKPFAPSCITREDIAVWQYGKDCHPINNDNGLRTSFNLNLVRNEWVITKLMY